MPPDWKEMGFRVIGGGEAARRRGGEAAQAWMIRSALLAKAVAVSSRVSALWGENKPRA